MLQKYINCNLMYVMYVSYLTNSCTKICTFFFHACMLIAFFFLYHCTENFCKQVLGFLDCLDKIFNHLYNHFTLLFKYTFAENQNSGLYSVADPDIVSLSRQFSKSIKQINSFFCIFFFIFFLIYLFLSSQKNTALPA